MTAEMSAAETLVTMPTLCILLHTVTRFRTNKQKQKSHIRLETFMLIKNELTTHINNLL